MKLYVLRLPRARSSDQIENHLGLKCEEAAERDH
jgi:hypothetical protein